MGRKNADGSISLELDVKQTVANINADLTKVLPQLKKLKIDAKLNKDSITSINNQLAKNNFSLKINDVKFANNIKNIGQNVGQQTGSNFSNAFNNSVNINKIPNIVNKSSTGFYAMEVDQLNERYERLGITIPGISKSLSQLKIAQEALDTEIKSGSNDIGKIQTLYKDYQSVLATTRGTISKTSSTYMSQSSVDSLIARLAAFKQKNTAITKSAASEIDIYIKSLSRAGNVAKSEGDRISNSLKRIENEQRALNRLGKSFADQIKSGIANFVPWLSTTTIIMTFINKVREAISTIIELDTALVDLQKTTSMTSTQLETFYKNSNSIAKEMGVTTEEIINQASAWSRLGYSSADAAEKMAKYSSQFAAISPGMDVNQATDGLVSVMKAFDIGNTNADDVLDGIMSKVNIIGNTAATSNAEIVDMLTRSSSAMKEANNTLDETIALETAAVEITRDADTVGTAYKTNLCLCV